MTQIETSAITRAVTNDFPVATTNGGGMIEVAQSRAAQEVQAAMLVAQRFPRDQNRAFTRIMSACKRKSLAERACYMYPKGGQNVTGPSIRLAETLAREWGNMDFGIVELEQSPGESIMMSYAWDLETNTRATKIFTVKHLRHTKKGAYNLDDPREIYEMTANQGARRLRACILAIIPGDIVEAALDQCDRTLEGASNEPLQDRVRNLLSAFTEQGVTQEMVETRMGHNIAATTYQEFANLYKVYVAIKDGFGVREDYFTVPTRVNETSAAIADTVNGAKAPPAPEPAPTPPPPAPAATTATTPAPQAASTSAAPGRRRPAARQDSAPVTTSPTPQVPETAPQQEPPAADGSTPEMRTEAFFEGKSDEDIVLFINSQLDLRPKLVGQLKQAHNVAFVAKATPEKRRELAWAIKMAIENTPES